MKTQQDITNYCINCGHKLEPSGDVKRCPSCGRHAFYNAKVTVTLWLTNDKGEALLTKRADEPFKDWWDTPGGFVEEHESLEDAARRELKEETNLEVGKLDYIGSYYDTYDFEGEARPIVAATFKGTLVDSDSISVGDDVSDYKFMKINEIDFDSIAFKNQSKLLKDFVQRTQKDS